ncbi:MAG: ornithine--oxo-acid transaminase [Lewinellaceae bacterium]|nr:ornithine--oxo-acid transaminase [Lewinellaceae bacterium]
MLSTTNTHTSAELMQFEDRYGAHNYHPLPVVLSKGDGVYVWDVEGKRYYDFLSAYSALNQGHCHPRLVNALVEQASQLALTSRAFYNDQLGPYERYITEYFGYDRILPMNSGAEAVETAIKVCRKWAYERKGIPNGEALIVVCGQNFHGRTTTIISFSSDPDAKGHFGPYTPGFISIPYNDLEALRRVLEEKGDKVAGFLVEPIQGEAGVFVPGEDFIPKAAALCRAHNVLFMADEIQTGIGRTGSLLAVCGNCTCSGHCERQEATYTRPDVLILGKALSGGMYPVSAVLADDPIMGVIKPGQHGSTFGGNPIASHVAVEALEVLRDEKLTQNARRLGKLFRERMQKLVDRSGLLQLVRGKGLLNAVVINDAPESSTAWDICVKLAENGLLAKPTHGNIIRFAPPLVMTEEQLMECCDIIERTFDEYSAS